MARQPVRSRRPRRSRAPRPGRFASKFLPAFVRNVDTVVGLKLAALVLGPLCALNLTVAFFGNSIVSPLSPFFLRDKVRALGRYASHRPRCLFRGHPEPAPLIAQAERRMRIPPGLLAALLQVESELHPHRISSAGAMGLGQLLPGTAALMHVDDPFDTAQGIEGSAQYLATQLAHFHDLRLAVAAYNAGPGNVGTEVPRAGETGRYVVKVMELYDRTRPTLQPRPTRALRRP